MDDNARSNVEPVHAVEVAAEPFAFVTIWTTGQIPPFRETEWGHDPKLYHIGDAKLSWVDEHYKDRAVRTLGYKQHFHVRGAARVIVPEFLPFMATALQREVTGYLEQLPGPEANG